MDRLSFAAAVLLAPALAGAQPGEGTWADPYRVDSLPWAHRDDTTTGVEMADAYLCGEGRDESGPEVVYGFELDHAARITAWVQGDVEGAVDGPSADADGVLDLVRGGDPGRDGGPGEGSSDEGCVCRITAPGRSSSSRWLVP